MRTVSQQGKSEQADSQKPAAGAEDTSLPGFLETLWRVEEYLVQTEQTYTPH